ncbi:MAG TPA: hypothetical protein VMV27_01645 [Candidatus Binataceae bacterium]|nr:hypothetical protein [Candidatus Binataceae bacterium]
MSAGHLTIVLGDPAFEHAATVQSNIKMNTSSIRARIARVFAALLFATLVTGCFGGGPGWGGGGWGGGYPGNYSNNYYSNGGYRGYDSYSHPGMNRSLFGGYAPGNEAWKASSRGRNSYGGHGNEGHGGGDRGGHHGGGHGRGGKHGH